MIHTVKGFSIVNEAHVFLELYCLLYDPTDVGNLISGYSAFSKSILNIWEFLVHVLLKPCLENFEHYFTSMWDECNCAVVWAFFGIAYQAPPSMGFSRQKYWKIPRIEEPGRLQSMGSLRVRHDWATSLSLFTSMHWRKKWQPTPVFLPGESQGRGSLVGCHLWGPHRVGHDWSDLAD